jgi:hypothetical protein
MKALVFLLVQSVALWCIDVGVLNVFTDLPDAFIKVDGLIVAKEAVVKLPLQVGDHYVQVELDNQVVYAKMVTIELNRSSTVVSDHFVDIITKTPSRGAIDREAERLRKSRGNIGFGAVSSMELQREMISLKWWAAKHLGGNIFLGGKTAHSNERGIVGARLFLSPADKIYNDQVLSGSVFLGSGRKTVAKSGVQNDTDGLHSFNYTEFGINIEAYIGQLVKELMMARLSSGVLLSKKTSVKKNNKTIEKTTEWGYDEFIRDVVFVVLTQIGHVSVELSMVQFPNQTAATNFSYGLHFYF